MISAMGDVVKVLADADRVRKAKIYSGLGLRLTYYPMERRVLISQASGRRPIGDRFVSEGGLEHATAGIFPGSGKVMRAQ